MFPDAHWLVLGGLGVLAFFALFDVSLREAGVEASPLAGRRLRTSATWIELAPRLTDLLIAQGLCLVMVWIGVQELAAASSHVLAAHGAGPPPIGGVSFARGGGHTLVGTSLLALGCAGLFRAGLTVAIRLDEGGLTLRRRGLGLLTLRRVAYPLEALTGFKVERSGRGARPVRLLASRPSGPPIEVLSQVAPVGLVPALTADLRRLGAQLDSLRLQLSGGSGRSTPAAATPAPTPSSSSPRPRKRRSRRRRSRRARRRG